MYWGIISEVASLLEVEGSVWHSRLKNWAGKQRNSNLLSRHILPLSNPLFYWCSVKTVVQCEFCFPTSLSSMNEMPPETSWAPLFVITKFTINLQKQSLLWGPLSLWRYWVIGSFCLCCFSSHEYCLLSNPCLPKSRIPSHSCRSTRQQWLFIHGCKNGPFRGLSHE